MWRQTKTLVTQAGRVCTCCLVKKVWKDFNIDKHNKFWYSSNCKECRNKMKQKYRDNKEVNEKELEYQKQYRETEIWKLKIQLDNIYYPATRQNRIILWKRNRKEALKTKIEYLHFTLWYELNYLKSIYNFSFSIR